MRTKGAFITVSIFIMDQLSASRTFIGFSLYETQDNQTEKNTDECRNGG